MGGSIEKILEKKEEILFKLSSKDDIEKTIAETEQKLLEKKKELSALYKDLTSIRKKYAKDFETELAEILKELSFSSATFEIYFEESEFTENGIDNIYFLFSANKGMPVLPLSKIASGGEISRLMLGIKSITGSSNITSIYDEIDTGISGKAAFLVGNKLKKLSNDSQIIIATHLPQIAAYADSHYRISKTDDENKTITNIKKLSEEESIEEIARMLSSGELTKSSIENAKELKQISSVQF